MSVYVFLPTMMYTTAAKVASTSVITVPGFPESIWKTYGGEPVQDSADVSITPTISQQKAEVIAAKYTSSLNACASCTQLFLAHMQSFTAPITQSPLEWVCVVHSQAGFPPPGGGGVGTTVVPPLDHYGVILINAMTGQISGQMVWG